MMEEYSKVTEDCPIGDDSGRISSSEAYKIASEYTPKSHHFIQLMKNSHLTSLYIPAHFAKHLPSKNHVEFEIRDKDKTWPIKTCYKKGDRSHSFSGGWSEFVCENHIMVGDILIIELDGVSELKVLLLKVLILRVKDPGPAHVNRFLPLTKPPRSTGSSDAQNKKRKALATEGFEVRPPPRTRSTGPVATDSPDDKELVHCHGFGLKRPEKDCLKCSRCPKKFCIDYLVKKFQVRANININSREWLCPSCKGDCDCKDCKDKLIVDDFLDEPSPPPPSHALYEVVERLLGRLKEYRQVFEDGLADINDRETTTPNWKEEQRLIKEKNTHLQEQCNETSKSIRQMVDLFPEDESIGFEYAELSRRDSEQEVQEVQEVQEEEEDEATLVEYSDHPIISLFTSTLQKLSGICKRLGAHCDILQAEQKKTAILNEKNKQLQANLTKEETFRRKLVNKLMDKRGNIRVFCRIRPRTHAGVGDSIPFESNIKDTITLFGDFPGRCLSKEYKFDQVFPVDASQEDIFLEISHLVDCAISGQKVCIFCFGRSGSGKTFSMWGGGPDHMRGIIERSLEKIFCDKETNKYNGKETTFVVTMREVLGKKETNLLEGPCSSTENNSKEKMWRLLKAAESKREKKNTMLNKASSSRHLFMEIQISSTNLSTGEASQGFLCFVDLAGNEKPDGDTALKGTEINKDLLWLGKVLTERGKNCEQTYRDCRLTLLLKDYLSEGSKMLTLLHIDPNSSCEETKNTLDFGVNAGSCNLAA